MRTRLALRSPVPKLAMNSTKSVNGNLVHLHTLCMFSLKAELSEIVPSGFKSLNCFRLPSLATSNFNKPDIPPNNITFTSSCTSSTTLSRKFKPHDPMMATYTSEAEFDEAYKTLFSTFATGKTKDLAWRKWQLKQVWYARKCFQSSSEMPSMV
jgi:hypothetical protein